NIVIIQACVNRAWKTSMEVGVRVVTEDLLSADRRYCCHAYLTFVALPQPPLATLTTSPTAPQRLPHNQAGDQEDSAAVKAALVNSPAARRYSFSLPSANKSKSKSSDGNSNSANNNQPKIQLPAIEPITQIEMERYTLAQSRREARLLQASSEYNLEEEKLLSDVRDQMRHWNVSQINHPRTQKLPPSLVDGSPQIAMQATFSESAQLVLPQHANSLSITFGGQVMKWMENVAAVSASRFARVPIVTASIDSLQFHRKTMIGDCLTMRSVVTRVFRSSMEVYVFVDSENLVTGKQTFTNEAFFSMVALQPSPSLSPIKTSLPTLFAASDLERSLSEAGEKRRLGRLQQRRELVEREMRGVLHTPTVERDEHSLRAADHITIGQYTHTE
ncbi:Acyl-coenzyme A thioesterase 11, partial [Linnemannia gamsii]